MKYLFISLTDYQLLNSINIKENILGRDQSADIIIIDNKEGRKELAERLEKLKIFDNVYVIKEYKHALKEYVRNFFYGVKNKELFFYCILEEFKFIQYNALKKVSEKEKSVKFLIENREKNIDFSMYDEVFCIDTKEIVKDIIQILKKYNKCKVNLLDEGIASYLFDPMKKDYHINKSYLYMPELSIYKDCREFVKIPKIDRRNYNFLIKLNTVFNFNTTSYIDIRNSIVFFDQNWDPMPEHLKNMNFLKKCLLYNTYKRHLKESYIYNRKIELFSKICKYISSKDILVKLHPYSNLTFLNDYKKYNCKILSNKNIPWEILLGNINIDNNVMITIHSGSVLSPNMVFEDNNGNVSILLYKIIFHDTLDNELETFFGLYKEYYKNDIFIPETEEEFLEILRSISYAK